MKKIGLIFVGIDSKIIKLTVDRIKDNFQNDYDIIVFKGENSDDLSIEECANQTDILIFVIDPIDSKIYAKAILEMFIKVGHPIFMIINFDDAEDEVLPYFYNIPKEALLNMVDDADEVAYETIFYSFKRNVAFNTVVNSDAKNIEALRILLKEYDKNC